MVSYTWYAFKSTLLFRKHGTNSESCLVLCFACYSALCIELKTQLTCCYAVISRKANKAIKQYMFVPFSIMEPTCHSVAGRLQLSNPGNSRSGVEGVAPIEDTSDVV